MRFVGEAFEFAKYLYNVLFVFYLPSLGLNHESNEESDESDGYETPHLVGSLPRVSVGFIKYSGLLAFEGLNGFPLSSQCLKCR